MNKDLVTRFAFEHGKFKFWKLVNKYTNDFDNHYLLANHRYTTKDIVDNYVYKTWLFNKGLIANPVITLEMLEELVLKNVDPNEVSMNPNITMEFVKKHMNYLHMQIVSENKAITIDDVRNNMDVNWCWSSICKNPNISEEVVDKFPDLPWDWYYGVSEIPNLSFKFITKNANRNWNWDSVCKNSKLTFGDFMLLNMYIKNAIREISTVFTYVRFQLPELRCCNIQGNKEYIMMNSNYTLNELIDIFGIEALIWHYVSKNPSISTDDIDKYPDKGWNFQDISYNKTITTDFIEKYLDRGWNFDVLCEHEYELEEKEYRERILEKIDNVEKFKEELMKMVFIPKRIETLLSKYFYDVSSDECLNSLSIYESHI